MTEETEKPHKMADNKRGRPFEPGHSGRPKGSLNHTTRMLKKLMESDAEAIVQTVINGAKAGDWTAAKIVIDRLVAPKRDNVVNLELPQIRTIEDVAAGLGVVVEAVADGEITPAEGSAVAGLLQNYSDALQLTDLTRRLEILESRANIG